MGAFVAQPFPEMAARPAPPLLFSISAMMNRFGIPGGYRLRGLLMRSGALNHIVRYDPRDGVRRSPLYVPMARPESSRSLFEVCDYEIELIRALTAAVNKLRMPTRLIDCGADIGMVATGLIRHCAGIVEVTAFEPNGDAFPYLERALAEAPVPAIAHRAAVGTESGRGRLTVPEGMHSAHAAYISPDPDGPIDVIRIDDVMSADGRAVLIKVDVEGTEDDVIAGASELLRAAPEFIVAFEAHGGVVERTGRDPIKVVDRLAQLAPISTQVAEIPGLNIVPGVPFFGQLGGQKGADGRPIFNVICRSHRRVGP